jgi:hypothetical protein
MSELLINLADAPDNLQSGVHTRSYVIDSDMYNICNRIREEVEGGDRLYIVINERGDTCDYTVMENTHDGSKIVMKCGPGWPIDALDARVIERLRYMLHVPFSERLKIVEKENVEYEKRCHDEVLENMYERFGGQMRWDLLNCGFTESTGVSLPLTNKNAMRHRRANAKIYGNSARTS